MEFFSLTYPWYDHTRKRQFLFISLYPLSFDEGRTSGAGVRPLSLPAQPALRHIRTGGGGKPPPYGCAGPKRAVRRRTLQSISAACHRRRPGGPGRYSAAAARACRVIDAGNPRRGSACDGHKKEPGVDARPVLALSVQLSAAMNPRTGGSRVGGAPPALLSPHFFGKKWGRPPRRHLPGGLASIERATTGRPYIVGPSCGSFASA